MYKDLLKYLCCPICKRPLRLTIREENNEEVIAGVLSCEACHAALIREGVVDFQSKEQELTNTWSKYYEKEDYASVDERMDHQKNEEQKQQEEKVKEDSQGFQIARDVMQKNQMEGGEAYFLSPSLRELHAQIFARISATRVVEAVSPGTEADLLPYKDEWFAFDVLDCQKAKKE